MGSGLAVDELVGLVVQLVASCASMSFLLRSPHTNGNQLREGIIKTLTDLHNIGNVQLKKS